MLKPGEMLLSVEHLPTLMLCCAGGKDALEQWYGLCFTLPSALTPLPLAGSHPVRNTSSQKDP